MIYTSKVKGFEGECKAVWLNTNIVDVRSYGYVTGFFKRVKCGIFGIRFKKGKEFHGKIVNNTIYST